MNKPLTEENKESRTTAIGLARYAYEFIDAAMLVEHNDPTLANISPIPAYFLALHGIELTLKSYLRHKGLTVNELCSREYGHKLLACYEKARELGLDSVFKQQPSDAETLRLLVELNEDQGLRYIKTGIKTFPLWPRVESLALGLHQAVAPEVGYNKTFAVPHHDETSRHDDVQNNNYRSDGISYPDDWWMSEGSG
jgi:hypothetical protein